MRTGGAQRMSGTDGAAYDAAFQGGLPERVDCVVVGGGIVGVFAALDLARAGRSVLLCEKGGIGLEQSGRNWGWCRTMGRAAAEIPLSREALDRWRTLEPDAGVDVGFRQCGTLYLAKSAADLRRYGRWIETAATRGHHDTTLLDAREVETFLPPGSAPWAGGMHTSSDGRAEPGRAAPVVAGLAVRAGAMIRTGCAVRGVETHGGRVQAVVTEHGRVACGQVLVAGGVWSRLLLQGIGLSLPQLGVISTAARTAPTAAGADIPDCAVGGPDFAYRRRDDGGYTIARRGVARHDLSRGSLALGPRFMKSWLGGSDKIRFRPDWSGQTSTLIGSKSVLGERSVFEQCRTLDPAPEHDVMRQGLRRLVRNISSFEGVRIAQTWAGMIDVLPDAVPVIDRSRMIEGLYIATGFSGHGFGIAPAAGNLICHIMCGQAPTVDPAPFAAARHGTH
ncbi:FAD-dependent oxidoreductase [Acetobacter fallax]|uniref:FAD-dependent oxidoreductase n=1 Tax=Acetobacter fallax TaxID=1737473 RepID=UPI00156A8BCF